MASREKNGKLSTNSTEEQMYQEVMDLFGNKNIMMLRIYDYHKRSEEEKEMLCDLFRGITLCKVPARDNNHDLIFFLGKEARV